MHINPYEARHASAVARVHRKSIRQIASEDYSDEEIQAWSSDTSKDPELPEDKHRFVAMQNEAVVGFADYTDDNEITALYVRPRFTRKGIGSQLLSKIEEDARKRGLNYLKATITVTAKPFYEHHEYAVLHETTYQIGDRDLKVYKVLKQL